jgi:hypothetical protein
VNVDPPPARPPSEYDLPDEAVLAQIEQVMADARERAAGGAPVPTPMDPGSTWW